MVTALQEVKPARFGRYVLLDRIGEGGMAEVYRAVLPGAEGFKRTFVIKKILAELSQSPNFVDMFVREARIGALLHHPNIVQVYDFGSVDGHYFLAMEYLRGRDVLAMIRRLRDMKKSFPIPVAAFVAREVANCLGYAHALTGPDGASLNIVHRDVSPSNVMCLREGGVKLLDFGIASAVSELRAEQTEQGTFRGKLAYMAPERVRNEPIDGRSDLYSLGVMLWEMLTCRRLFRGGTDGETLKKMLEMSIPAPSTHRPEIPPSLDAIVLKALARERDHRYATGQAMADDLEEAMRETKFNSRTLPKLLGELFGSGAHSSQVALECITPELLAAASGVDLPVLTAQSMVPDILETRPSFWRSWRPWAVGGVALTLVGTALAVGLRSPAKPELPERPAVTEEARAAAAFAPPPPGPAPAPAAAPLPAATSEDEDLPVTEPRAKASSHSRRHAKSRARSEENPIARGLSIDPFAEAAQRGHR